MTKMIPIGMQKLELIEDTTGLLTKVIYSFNEVTIELWEDPVVWNTKWKRENTEIFISYMAIPSMRRTKIRKYTGFQGNIHPRTNDLISVGSRTYANQVLPEYTVNSNPEYGMPYVQVSGYIPPRNTDQARRIHGVGLCLVQGNGSYSIHSILAYSRFHETCLQKPGIRLIVNYRVMFNDYLNETSGKNDVDTKMRAFLYKDSSFNPSYYPSTEYIGGNNVSPPKVVGGNDNGPSAFITNQSDDNINYRIKVEKGGIAGEASYSIFSTVKDIDSSLSKDHSLLETRDGEKLPENIYHTRFIDRYLVMSFYKKLGFLFIDLKSGNKKRIKIEDSGNIPLTKVINIGYSSVMDVLYIADKSNGIFRVKGIKNWVENNSDLDISKIIVPGGTVASFSARYDIYDKKLHLTLVSSDGIYIAEDDMTSADVFSRKVAISGVLKNGLDALHYAVMEFMNNPEAYNNITMCEQFSCDGVTEVLIKSLNKKEIITHGLPDWYRYYGITPGMTQAEMEERLRSALPAYYIQHLIDSGQWPPGVQENRAIHKIAATSKFIFNKDTYTLELAGSDPSEYLIHPKDGRVSNYREDNSGEIEEKFPYGDRFHYDEVYHHKQAGFITIEDDKYWILPGYKKIKIALGSRYSAYRVAENNIFIQKEYTGDPLLLDLKLDRSNKTAEISTSYMSLNIDSEHDGPYHPYRRELVTIFSDIGIQFYNHEMAGKPGETYRVRYKDNKDFNIGERLLLDTKSNTFSQSTWIDTITRPNSDFHTTVALNTMYKFDNSDAKLSWTNPNSANSKVNSGAEYRFSRSSSESMPSIRHLQSGVLSKEYVETGIVKHQDDTLPVNILYADETSFLVADRGTPETPLICSFIRNWVHNDDGTPRNLFIKLDIDSIPDARFGSLSTASSDTIYSVPTFTNSHAEDGVFMELSNSQSRGFYLSSLPVLKLNKDNYIAKIGSKELATGVYDKYFTGIEKSTYTVFHVYIDGKEAIINKNKYLALMDPNYIPGLTREDQPTVTVDYDLGLILFPDEYAGKTYTVKYRYFRDIGFDLRRVDAIMSMEEIEAYARGEYD